MSAPKHTPEPWFAGTDVFCDQVFGINGHADAVMIAACEGNHANAVRIVACVNACESIEDPEADIRGMQSACASLAVRLGQVERQRDELSAVVSEFEAIAWDGCPLRRETDDLCIRARAALKSISA